MMPVLQFPRIPNKEQPLHNAVIGRHWNFHRDPGLNWSAGSDRIVRFKKVM